MKLLVLFEALLCFGPAALLLFLGVFMIPVQVYMFLTLPELKEDPGRMMEGLLLLIPPVIAGCIGLGVLMYVLWKLLRAEAIGRPLPVVVAVLVGLVPVLRLAFDWGPESVYLVVLPFVATLHILYLSWPLMLRQGERFPARRDGWDVFAIAVLALVGSVNFIPHL